MKKNITTEGFIVDKQLVRKLGKVGILLSYYIDCYNFYADESGVFYRSRFDVRNDTDVSIQSQITYEKKLIELGLLDITYGNVAQSNRIKLHPESIILYRNTHPTLDVARPSLDDAQTILDVTRPSLDVARPTLDDAQTILDVNERIPTDERTEITTDVPTDTQLTSYEPSKLLSNTDIRNVQTASLQAITKLYPHLSAEDIDYYKQYKL
jgi:hypothetical protein